MADSPKVAVIGGGISGLACAYRLKKLGVPFVLLEAEEQAGGLIGTVEKDGFIFETGPQSFQGTETLLDLISDLGIKDELLEADARAPRYVLRHGRLAKIPMTPQAMLTTSLLGAGTRLRVVAEAFRKSKPPAEEESVAQFVRRKFGHEILEYLVAPFVSGVYAGDPEQLSLRAAFPSLDEWEREYGSVLRGAMKSRPEKAEGAKQGPPPLCSFKRGVATLTGALRKALGDGLRTGARVTALSKTGSAYEIRVADRGGYEGFGAQAVVMAAPAYVASQLLGQTMPSLAARLSGIAYATVGVIGTGYHAKQCAQELDGFGVLIPRSEQRRTLGIVWNSSLFAGRAPEGKVALTSFVGGTTDPAIMEKPDSEIAAIVQSDHTHILKITGAPVTAAIWRHPKALPQYNLGHGHVVGAIRDGERTSPGIFFAGNYLHGPSIGKCVEQGFETAEAVKARLSGGENRNAKSETR